jgi:hypothetical protein
MKKSFHSKVWEQKKSVDFCESLPALPYPAVFTPAFDGCWRRQVAKGNK